MTSPDDVLPRLASCSESQSVPPELPPKWIATALMAPFVKAQLTVSEITYDASLPAMRVNAFGVERGSIGFLVTKDSVYLLDTADDPSICYGPLSPGQWKLPTRRLLSTDATCTGVENILDVESEWWKSPSDADPATNWQWYRADTRLPWRMMNADTTSLPVLGGMAMINFPTFTEVAETNLASVLDKCRSSSSATSPFEDLAATDVLGLLERSGASSGASGDAVTGNIIPGISYDQCSTVQLPVFPDRFEMTVLMTAVNKHYDPFPTNVLYDWSRGSQLTRMMQPDTSRWSSIDALLINKVGYDISRGRDGSDVCKTDLPGIPVPTWMNKDGCECKAVIAQGSVLSPNDTTQVITCPIVGSRVFWTWYTTLDRPVMFMETAAPAAEGTGLCLADYYSFDAGASIDTASFAIPNNCPDDDRSESSIHHHAGSGIASGCFNCHEGPSQMSLLSTDMPGIETALASRQARPFTIPEPVKQ